MAWEAYPSSTPTSREINSSLINDDDSLFDFRNADALDIFMFFSIILSLVISPMIVIFFVRKYFCLAKEMRTELTTDDIMNPAFECIVKKNRIPLEDFFKTEELEDIFVGRSNASSMDRGYNAQYIKCTDHKQQNRSISFSL